MQRSLVVALILILAAVGALWLFSGGEAPPPPPSGPGENAESSAGAANAASVPAPPTDGTSRAAQRVAVASQPADVLDDPEIRAGLTGFKGRVVTHQKQPVADCGVRIYRGAMDSILPDGVDVFAEAPTLVPQYVAGETRTAADGTFLVGGVWPRGFYVMFAGIGTDAPMHQLLTRTPSPGEIVDLGDVVLPDAGVITGTVLDDEGAPLPGALVRAADVPGTLAAFFPVERFDPEGALLIREQSSPVKVIEMPHWVKDAFEHLPIPSTRTDAEGHFRLVGVIPGSNMVATTMRGFLSDVKPSIQVRAGQVKDVGRIKMKRGEELAGQVLDSAGKPVAAAEVLAGSTLSMAPVDLAQQLGKSDDQGRFAGQGFAPGKVTVAARRGPGHAWVLAEPQAVLGTVVVTLPSTFGVDVAVTLADGKPAKEPRFKLLHGKAGDGAAEMAVFGFVPPVDLRDRQKLVAEGRWRIDNLLPGRYTLAVEAPGHATAFSVFDLTNGDAAVQLALPLRKEFVVRVVNHEDRPIRNVAVYAEARGSQQLFDMPLRCGRTDADGRLAIDKLQAESLRVSADHPRWGVVHGECKQGQELVLRMLQPGRLHGILTESGKPAAPGEFTIALEHRRGSGPRGPLEAVPAMLTPGPDGSFTATALQPGEYRVHAIKSLDALRSPGGVFAMMQDMWLFRDGQSESVEVQSGQTAEVRLDTGQKPIEGPTAHLFGSVTVDGRLAAGYPVMAYGGDRRFTARVDERGRFDLGVVPAGSMHVTVMGVAKDNPFGGMGNNLWSTSVELKEAEERELTILVTTSSIAGTCTMPDGSPAAGVWVQGQGQLKGAAQGLGNVWVGSQTDAQGNFQFSEVAEGTWSFHVRGNGEKAGRGKLDGVVVTGGIPIDSLRIQLERGIVVKGRIDVSVFGNQKPQWSWVAVHKLPENGGGDFGDQVDGFGIDTTTGNFQTDDLVAGTYRLRMHASLGENDHRQYRCEDLIVPPQGVENVVLHPVPEK